MLPKARLRRFLVKKGVAIHFESSLSEKINLQVVNISIRGIAAKGSIKLENADQIFTQTTLKFGDKEIFLGRIVLVSTKGTDNEFLYGFNLIDNQISISRDLEEFVTNSTGKQSEYSFEIDSEHFTVANFAENTPSRDIFKKCRDFKYFMASARDTNLYYYETIREDISGARVNLPVRRPNGRNDYIMMASNDYFGMSSNQIVKQKCHEVIDKYGFGSTGSIVVTGNTDIHEHLCEFLSRLYGKKRTILFNSGYAANSGAMSALISSRDLVIVDQLAHASIQRPLLGTLGTVRHFKHNNYEHLDKILTETRAQSNGCLIVTEGVFSMEGDYPELDKVIELKNKHSARLFIDEAHSLGIIGNRGIGVVEKYNCMNETDMIMGNLSKTLGSLGGFICCDDDVADWLHAFAPSRIFSTSIPPVAAQAALTALKLIFEEGYGVAEIKRNIRHFVKNLRDIGVNISSNHDSAVVPVIVPDQKKLGNLAVYMKENGVLVFPCVYPVVSRNQPRLRFTIMSSHSLSDLDYVTKVLEIGLKKFKIELP